MQFCLNQREEPFGRVERTFFVPQHGQDTHPSSHSPIWSPPLPFAPLITSCEEFHEAGPKGGHDKWELRQVPQGSKAPAKAEIRKKERWSVLTVEYYAAVKKEKRAIRAD